MTSLALASVGDQSRWRSADPAGPANLSLCIALHENEEAKEKHVSMCFLEKQAQFAW